MRTKNNNLKNFDVILVLSNEMNREGELNRESKARANKAIKVFKSYSAKYLITSGWDYRKDTDLCIATAFKNYIISNSDIKSNLVLTELNSRDTVGDAYFTKTNIVIPNNFRKLCVITSNYHIFRTRRIFNLIYGNKYYISFFGVKLLPSFSSIMKDSTMLGSEFDSANNIVLFEVNLSLLKQSQNFLSSDNSQPTIQHFPPITGLFP